MPTHVMIIYLLMFCLPYPDTQWTKANFDIVETAPDCPADNSIILHGKAGHGLGCAYACDRIGAKCAGFALYDDGANNKCNVEMACSSFTHEGEVFSRKGEFMLYI